MTTPSAPTIDEAFRQTCDVVAMWAKKPRDKIMAETELKKLRPGKLRALGLALMAHFENDYAPQFDEQSFDTLWSTATIRTVQNAYWVVLLAFS